MPNEAANPEVEYVAEPDFTDALAAFVNLGFDEIDALHLARAGCSPSEARERFLLRGASLEATARILLP